MRTCGVRPRLLVTCIFPGRSYSSTSPHAPISPSSSSPSSLSESESVGSRNALISASSAAPTWRRTCGSGDEQRKKSQKSQKKQEKRRQVRCRRRRTFCQYLVYKHWHTSIQALASSAKEKGVQADHAHAVKRKQVMALNNHVDRTADRTADRTRQTERLRRLRRRRG